jgi:hypothetical protein
VKDWSVLQTSLDMQEVKMTKDLIDDMLKRPARQSMDGLNEIQFGIVFLFWGAVGAAIERWGASEWVRWSCLALILVVALLSKPITQRLRVQWVHPRIGYVKWTPQLTGKPLVAFFLGGIVTLLTIVALTRSPQFRSSLPVFMGWLLAMANGAWWIRLRIRRLLVYALLTLASGLIVGWKLPGMLGFQIVMCLVSVFYLVGGFLALRQTMREPQASEDHL